MKLVDSCKEIIRKIASSEAKPPERYANEMFSNAWLDGHLAATCEIMQIIDEVMAEAGQGVNPIMKEYFAECQKCDCIVGEAFNYCPKCGQKLDWQWFWKEQG